MNRILLGTAAVALAAALFGTLGYVTRNAAAVGMDSSPFIAWRGLIGMVALVVVGSAALALAGGGQRMTGLRVSRRNALIAAAVVGAILNIAMFAAFLRTTIAVVLICFYTFPSIVTLAAVRLYGERLDRVRAAALVLSASGLVLVVLGPLIFGGPGAGVVLDPLGIGLAFVAALCQATFVLLAGRGFAPLPAAFAGAFLLAVTAVAAVVLALATGAFDALLTPLRSADVWPWIIAGSITGAAVPTTAFIYGISIIGPSRAAILMTIEPLVAIGLAAFFLGETPSPIQFVGGLAVIVAAAILQLVPSKGVVPEPEFGPVV